MQRIGDWDRPSAWFLGSTARVKMMHRPDCRHARRPYTWAGECSPAELAEKLRAAGRLALQYNDACYFCAGALRWELRRLREELAIER